MKNDLRTEHLSQEVTVTLPLSVVLRIAEQHPGAVAPVQLVGQTSLPAIGHPWQDGTFAGVSLDGDQRVALVLLHGDEKLNWADAVAWAEKQGGALPSRIDQLVLFRNVKAEFKDAWYWSGEQYAGYAGYAWCQNFSYGSQGSLDGKGLSLRARAVRRIPIQ